MKKKTAKRDIKSLKKEGLIKARKIDNLIALGSVLTVAFLGYHLNWYDFYTENMCIAFWFLTSFWRVPMIAIIWLFSKKEREYWGLFMLRYTLLWWTDEN